MCVCSSVSTALARKLANQNDDDVSSETDAGARNDSDVDEEFGATKPKSKRVVGSRGASKRRAVEKRMKLL